MDLSAQYQIFLEIFSKYESKEIGIDESARQLALKLGELLDHSDITGKPRNNIRSAYNELDEGLDTYRNIHKLFLATENSQDKLDEADSTLNQIINATRDTILEFFGRQTQISSPTNVIEQTMIREGSKIPSWEGYDSGVKKYSSEANANITKLTDKVKQNPDDQTAHNSLGNALFSVNRYEEAILEYKEAIRIKKDDYIYYSNIGDAYRKLGEYRKAIDWYKNALGINSDDDILQNAIGTCYLSLQEYKSAIDHFNQAIGINPTKIYLVNAGDAYALNGQYDTAIGLYKGALLIDDTYSYAHERLGWTYMMLFTKTKDNIAIQQSIEYYQKALQHDPDDAKVFGPIGDAYYYAEEWDNGIKYFQKAVGQDAEDYRSLDGLGYCYMMKQDYDNANIYFNKALDIKSEDYDTLIHIGILKRILEEYDNALKFYLRAQESKPDSAEVHNAIGLIYFYKTDYINAIKYYERSLNLDANEAVYYSNIALAYHGLKNWDEAKRYISKAIQLDPDNPIYLLTLGDTYSGMFNFPEAISQYNKALEIDQNYLDVYSALSTIYARIKNWDQALNYAQLGEQKARLKDPNDQRFRNSIALIYNYMGLSLYYDNKHQQAIEQYQKGLGFNQLDILYYNIHMAYFALALQAREEGDSKQLDKDKQNAKDAILKAIGLRTVADPKYIDALARLDQI